MIINLIKGGFFNQLKIILIKKKVDLNQVDFKYNKIFFKMILWKILRILELLYFEKIVLKKNFIFLIKNI